MTNKGFWIEAQDISAFVQCDPTMSDEAISNLKQVLDSAIEGIDAPGSDKHRVGDYYFNKVSGEREQVRHAQSKTDKYALCGRHLDEGARFQQEQQAPKCQKCLRVIHRLNLCEADNKKPPKQKPDGSRLGTND